MAYGGVVCHEKAQQITKWRLRIFVHLRASLWLLILVFGPKQLQKDDFRPKAPRTRRVVDGHTAVHPSGRPDRGRLAGRVTLLLWPTATTPRTRRIPKLLVVSAIPHACRGDALGGLATKCATTLHANHRRPSRSHASPTIPTASAGDSHQQPRDAPSRTIRTTLTASVAACILSPVMPVISMVYGIKPT